MPRMLLLKPEPNFIANFLNEEILVILTDQNDNKEFPELFPNMLSVERVKFADLTLKKLANIRPDIVISPLVVDKLDALDIARFLQDAGFKGCYRIMDKLLACASIVLAEVAQAAPNIDFDIL